MFFSSCDNTHTTHPEVKFKKPDPPMMRILLAFLFAVLPLQKSLKAQKNSGGDDQICLSMFLINDVKSLASPSYKVVANLELELSIIFILGYAVSLTET